MIFDHQQKGRLLSLPFLHGLALLATDHLFDSDVMV